MIKRIVLYLVRKKLGLKKNQWFEFVGQKSTAMYCFGDDMICKYYNGLTQPSGVSLNWLLDDRCEIRKLSK